MLDAGCGRHLHMRYPGLDLRDAYVVGIDISPVLLEAHPRLDQRILGDLQTHSFERNTFDVVVCQDVLEHLIDPGAALTKMAHALRPGGELVLAWSNPASLKGLVTKFTPHRFHIWVYKRGWFGFRYGGPDGPPFKTHLRWSLRPNVVRQLLMELGFETIRVELYPHRAFTWAPRFARFSECRARAIKRRSG